MSKDRKIKISKNKENGNTVCRLLIDQTIKMTTACIIQHIQYHTTCLMVGSSLHSAVIQQSCVYAKLAAEMKPQCT